MWNDGFRERFIQKPKHFTMRNSKFRKRTSQRFLFTNFFCRKYSPQAKGVFAPFV